MNEMRPEIKADQPTSGPAAPNAKDIELRKKLNSAFLEAGLLVQKHYHGVDYLAVAPELQEEGVSLLCQSNYSAEQLSVIIRAPGTELPASVENDVRTAIDDAGIDFVTIRHERPLVPSRAKAKTEAASATETGAETSLPAPDLSGG